eukprot:gene6859-7077_t
MSAAAAAKFNPAALNLRKRFTQKRLSLAAAIQDDEQLVGLTEAEILQVVRSKAAEAAQGKQLLRLRSYKGATVPTPNSSSPSRAASNKPRGAEAAQISFDGTPDGSASGGTAADRRLTRQEVLRTAEEDQMFSLGGDRASGALLAAAAAARWTGRQNLASMRLPGAAEPLEAAAAEGSAASNQQQQGAEQLADLVARRADGDAAEELTAENYAGREGGLGGDEYDDHGDHDDAVDNDLEQEDEEDWAAPASQLGHTLADHQDLLTEGLPAMLRHMSMLRQRGQQSAFELQDVAAAAHAALPLQQHHLTGLRRVAAVTNSRLQWQTQRPKTYDLALTSQQRNIRGLAQVILNDIINAVLGHIAMRPSKQQVAVEVAEWQAKRPAALAAISRHLGDGIFKDVVDDLLAEVATEVAAGAAAAESFALDMLVSAVAFSQGKFDLGVSGMQQPSSDATSSTAALGAAGPVSSNRLSNLAREAALLQKAAYKEATGDAVEAGTGTSAGRPVVAAGDVNIELAEEDVYQARRDFTAADASLAAGTGRDTASAARGAAAGARTGGGVLPARSLYLAGLRGMLGEMRGRRPPDTPYGHTQHLTPHLKPGATVSKYGSEDPSLKANWSLVVGRTKRIWQQRRGKELSGHW